MKKEINTHLYEPMLTNLFEVNVESDHMDPQNLAVLESQIIDFNHDEKYIRFNINYIKHKGHVEIIPYDIVYSLIGKPIVLKLNIFDKIGDIIFRMNYKAYFSEIKEFFNFAYLDDSPKFMKVYFKELE